MELLEVANPFVLEGWGTILSYGSPPHGGFGMDVTVRGTENNGQAWWYILGLTNDGNAYRWLGREEGSGQRCTGSLSVVHGTWHSVGNVAVWDTDGPRHGPRRGGRSRRPGDGAAQMNPTIVRVLFAATRERVPEPAGGGVMAAWVRPVPPRDETAKLYPVMVELAGAKATLVAGRRRCAQSGSRRGDG